MESRQWRTHPSRPCLQILSADAVKYDLEKPSGHLRGGLASIASAWNVFSKRSGLCQDLNGHVLLKKDLADPVGGGIVTGMLNGTQYVAVAGGMKTELCRRRAARSGSPSSLRQTTNDNRLNQTK